MANTFNLGDGSWAQKTEKLLAYNAENDNYKPLPFDFDRASTATKVNKQGLIETVGVDKPRIDFLNNTKGHLLLEPQSTNLLPYSEDFSQSSYIKDSGITIGTQDNISPGVIANATRIDVTNSGRIYSNLTSSTYYSTVFIKAGTFSYFKLAGKQVDLVAETIVGGSIKSYANGWYRVGYTYTGNRPFQVQAYPDNTYTTHTTSGNYYIWGAQAEELSFASSYIPTQGETNGVTRSAESCSGAGNSTVINSTEGVLYWEASALADDGTDRRIALSDGTLNNYVSIGYSRFSGNIVAEMISGGVLQTTDWGATGFSQTNNNKFAMSWGSGTMKFYINGVQKQTASVTSPIGMNNLRFSAGNGVYKMFSNTKDIKVYNTALTDAELIALTS